MVTSAFGHSSLQIDGDPIPRDVVAATVPGISPQRMVVRVTRSWSTRGNYKSLSRAPLSASASAALPGTTWARGSGRAAQDRHRWFSCAIKPLIELATLGRAAGSISAGTGARGALSQGLSSRASIQPLRVIVVHRELATGMSKARKFAADSACACIDRPLCRSAAGVR